MACLLDFTSGNVSEIIRFYLQQHWPDAPPHRNSSGCAQESSTVHHFAPTMIKRRRKRTRFSKMQLSQLQWVFSVTRYPDVRIREILASATGIPESKIQIWFQNRRARYMKTQKLSRRASNPQVTYTTSPSSQMTFSPSQTPTGYREPDLLLSTRLSTHLDIQARSLPAPTSPGQASSPYGSGQSGVPQNHYHQSPDSSDYCRGVFSRGALDEWDLTEEFEAFLRDAQGSRQADSRCAGAAHPVPIENVQSWQDHTDTKDSLDDLLDLCTHDLIADLNLDMSPAMIDFLLGD